MAILYTLFSFFFISSCSLSPSFCAHCCSLIIDTVVKYSLLISLTMIVTGITSKLLPMTCLLEYCCSAECFAADRFFAFPLVSQQSPLRPMTDYVIWRILPTYIIHSHIWSELNSTLIQFCFEIQTVKRTRLGIRVR